MERSEIRGISGFILISYGLAWSIWGAMYFADIKIGSSAFSIGNMLAVFAPAIAALISRKWISKEGFSDVGWKIPLKTIPIFLLALIFPLIVFSATFFIASGLELQEVGFNLQKAFGNKDIPDELKSIQIWQFALILMVNSIPATLVLFGEEFGWRGYLQKKLDHNTPWKAAVITGVIWGAWHYPINLQGYNYPEYRLWGLVVFPVACIFLSYILHWFYKRTQSIFAPCLAHSAFNSVAASLMIVTYLDNSLFIVTSVVGVIGTVVLALIALLLHRIEIRA